MRTLGTLAGLAVLAVMATPAGAVIIDHFDQGTSFNLTTWGLPLSPPPVTTATWTESGLTNVLGGTRNVDLTWMGGDNGGHNHLDFQAVNSYVNLDDDVTLVARLKLSYAFSATDFTDGGTSNSVLVRFLASDLGSTTKVTLTDSLAGTGSLTVLTPSGPSDEIFLFSLFSGSLDFTKITSVVYQIDTVPSGDYRIDLLGSGYVPEPVTMAGLVLGIGGLVGYARRRVRA